MAAMNNLLAAAAIFASIVNGQLNCSIHNPCGHYGYCRDDAEGNITCECKFWWNGTYCNEQTNSGIQVITLGCLLGVLLLIFYGLSLFRCIRNRRRQPKETKTKVITNNQKLIEVALKIARRKARLSSLIITIFMAILAAAGLVSKWSIIQPIHDEIARKFLANESLYYIQNPMCKIFHWTHFNLIIFPAACLLVLIFIIRTKRTSLLRNKCYGYGGPPMPVDFLSHIDRKFAAVIFAICADELLSIIQDAIGGSGSNKGDGVIIVYLRRLLQVLIMGFHYYPLLVAVYINSILTLICGTLYAWLDYSITIVDLGMCKADFYPTYDDYLDNSSSIAENFDYYGTGQTLIAVQLCTDIPRFLCLAYISVKLPAMLINKIYHRYEKNVSIEKQLIRKLTREERFFFHIARPTSIEMLYVRNLFCSAHQRLRSQALIARLIPMKIYEWRDDFRFSTRVLCIYSSLFLLLYFVAIQAFIRILPLLISLQKFLQELFDAVTTVFMANPEQAAEGGGVNGNTSNLPFPSLVRPYVAAICLTLVLIIIQLLVLLANIRRNLFQSFRGDDTEIPRRVRSKYVSFSSGNVHFAGYFIGYLIWGFMLIAIFAAILCICIEAFITYGNVRFLETILKAIIPSILFVFFKQYLNKILAQYVFLQHYGDVLSINNRRLLMIFIYFNFFLDAFLGFISSIIRLIKSVVWGIIYMCRLDYSPLGRKLETMDGGFSAYCGFIHTECVHRHPVVLVFAAHLYTQVKMRQITAFERHFSDLKPTRNLSRYVRKWKLAVFLIRNPTIVFFRKAFLNQLHIDEIHALNDLDSDEKKSVEKRLSIYTRRMSTARTSIASNGSFSHHKQHRF